MLHPNLSRAEDVPRRVQRHAHAADVQRLAVGQRVNGRVGPEPGAEDALARGGDEVAARAAAGVVAVGVGEDGPVGGPPGVDVEAARGAEEAGVGQS